jgi:hypothetical protein
MIVAIPSRHQVQVFECRGPLDCILIATVTGAHHFPCRSYLIQRQRMQEGTARQDMLGVDREYECEFWYDYLHPVYSML